MSDERTVRVGFVGGPVPTPPCAHWIERTRKAEAEVERLRDEVEHRKQRNLDDTGKLIAAGVEHERLREEYVDFLANVTRRLNGMGVPAMPSWETAFDYVAARLAEVERLREAAVTQTLRLMEVQEQELNDVGAWGAGYRQALTDLRENLRLRFGSDITAPEDR